MDVDVAPAIALNGVTRVYGSTKALVNADLPLMSGRIVALLGENGAGKSTSAKILCGVEQPDSGHVEIGGVPVVLAKPRDAHEHGVFFIPQELAFVPGLTVAENIMLGWAPSTFGMTKSSAVIKAAAAHADSFGFNLDVRRPMRELPLADIQMVEILKALRVGARAIILDEPTSSLTEDESERLFQAMRSLARGGTSIAFVSHRLDEVMDGSDEVYVFRNGRIVKHVKTSDTTREMLLQSMLGRPFTAHVSPRSIDIRQDPGLAIVGWRNSDQHLDLDRLQFGRSEITVLYGLRGSGSDLVVEAIAGAQSIAEGQMQVDGVVVGVPTTPRASRRLGIAHVPADRRRQGLLMHLSVEENLVIHRRSRTARCWIRRGSVERREARRAVEDFRIRVSSSRQAVSELSGGNQQKVLLASRLNQQPKVLVLQEPTRGVDVGARDEIHQILGKFARNGATVVVATSDFEEALQLADRIVVFRRGVVVSDLRGDQREQALNFAKGTSYP